MSIPLIKDLLKSAESITAQVHQSSALNPLLWLTIGVTTCLGVILMVTSLIWLKIILAVLIGITLLTTLGCYVYFAICKPDLLRSEKFQLVKQQMEMLGDENNEFEPGTEVEDTSNPTLPPPSVNLLE